MFSSVKLHGREHGVCRSKREFIVSKALRQFLGARRIASSPLRTVDVGAGTEKHLSGLHHRFRQRRMRVDG